MCVCIYIHTYIYICIHTHTHTHTHTDIYGVMGPQKSRKHTTEGWTENHTKESSWQRERKLEVVRKTETRTVVV